MPVTPDFGYVNCMGNKNCLAQYQINADGRTINQTEILKSKKKKLIIFSWTIL